MSLVEGLVIQQFQSANWKHLVSSIGTRIGPSSKGSDIVKKQQEAPGNGHTDSFRR